MFNPKAILFDSDGVVVDSEMARDDLMRNILLGFGVQYDRNVTKPKLSGKAEMEMMNILIADYNLKIEPQELSALRKNALNDLYQNKVAFVPGFTNLYHSLKKNFSAKIAIASGCETSLFRGADKRLKISELADGPNMIFESELLRRYIFLSHEIDIPSKPAPDIFLYALKHMNLQPQDSVVFEDAPNGIAASIAAGIPKTVAITRTFNENILREKTMELTKISDFDLDKKVLFIPDYSVSSIAQVVDYLKK